MGYITGVEKNPSKQTLAMLSNVIIIGIQNKKSYKRGAYKRMYFYVYRMMGLILGG